MERVTEMGSKPVTIDLDQCPILVKTFRGDKPGREYVALLVKDRQGIVLNGVEDVPEKILQQLSRSEK